MLEFDDIQHILLTRTPAMTGRYEFLTFDDSGRRAGVAVGADRPGRLGCGRADLDGTAPTGGSRWRSPGMGCARWAYRKNRWPPFPTSSGRAWRPAPTSSATPGRRIPTTGSAGWPVTDLHAIAILFARDDAEHARCIAEHDELIARCPGVRKLSFLDLNATPPFNYAHDHFGFRDRLSQPVIEGSGEEPTPGSGAALKPGEFILGYPDEDGPVADLPEPEVLSRNGSYMAYRRLEEHVGLFRDYLREKARDPRGAGTARREVHGPLAQRCPVGAGAGSRRS